MQTMMPEARYALEVQDLTAVLGGQKVLDAPVLGVKQNEVFVIVGPNGSGKTTLLLCLALLLKPAAGCIRYGGADIQGQSRLKLRRETAVVFQDPLLLDRTVRDNVDLGLRLRHVRRGEIRPRTEKWLGRFGVSHLAGRQARLLSGGEAKRVSLARAFALEPRILFLDEPFNALDTPTRQSLLEEFEVVLRETKTTTVMVTHDHNEALVVADRLAVLIGGTVHQVGTPREVFSLPADEDVASFVKTGNILQGVISHQSAGLAMIDIGRADKLQAVSDMRSGTRVAVFIRYEDVGITVGHTEGGLSGAKNELKGTIVRAFPLGSQLRVTLDCGFLVSSLVTRGAWEDLRLDIGKQVTASFKASSVHLMPKS